MRNIIDSLLTPAGQKLSSREAALLKALLTGPMAIKLLDEAEAAEVQRRRTLVASLVELPRIHDADISRAGEACNAAADRLEKAREVVRQAEADLVQLRAAASAAQDAKQRRAWELQTELRSTADPRLQQFIDVARLIADNDLPRVFVTGMERVKTDTQWGGTTWVDQIFTNANEMAAAREALAEVIQLAQAMQLEAVRSDEVGRAIATWCRMLVKPLAAVQLNAPCLAADLSTVGLPMRWAGRPVVLAEDEVQPTQATLRKVNERNKDLPPLK